MTFGSNLRRCRESKFGKWLSGGKGHLLRGRSNGRLQIDSTRRQNRLREEYADWQALRWPIVCLAKTATTLNATGHSLATRRCASMLAQRGPPDQTSFRAPRIGLQSGPCALHDLRLSAGRSIDRLRE